MVQPNSRPYPIADRPDETVIGRGLRALAYVLQSGATFELSDQDLELADHAYPIAVSNPEILPAAVDLLTRARHLIIASITCRRAFDRDRLAALQGAELQPSVPPAGGKQPGAAVPRQPAPRPLAPIGSAADIAF